MFQKRNHKNDFKPGTPVAKTTGKPKLDYPKKVISHLSLGKIRFYKFSFLTQPTA
jgi:hypothetical protein